MNRGFQSLLQGVAERATKSGVFGPVSVREGVLVCAAKNSAQPAEYRLCVEAGKVWVSLVTPNRWLSESIEADLMHTGDKMEELLEEELAELDYKAAAPGVQHFRSDDKLFTFRSVVPVGIEGAADAKAVGVAGTWLLAYEACFRRLGDMDAGMEEG